MKSSGVVVKEGLNQSQKSYWWQQNEAVTCAAPAPKPGNCCPACSEGILAYDSLFLLTCSHCGQVAESGGFT